MTGPGFVLRGVWHFRGSYAGVVAACAVGAMVLLGALFAGDSVKESLRRHVEMRLGRVEAVMGGGDRMFRAALAADLAADRVEAAPVMATQAEVSEVAGGRVRAGVAVYGVDERFFRMGPGGGAGQRGPEGREVWVNEALAAELGVQAGGALSLRFAKPGAMPGDVPMAGNTSVLQVIRGEVARVAGDLEFGRFSLASHQMPQPAVFLPIGRLQEAMAQEGKANLLLLAGGAGRLAELLRGRCTLADYGVVVDEVPLAGAVELRSERVFFDRPLAARIREVLPGAEPLVTYLANTLAAKGKTTPYSMVTAVGRGAAPFLPEADGAVLNAWEAEDLGAGVGDEVRIDYYALDEANRLVERSALFPVVGVVPMEGLAADRRWMPDFPGVADAENAVDWDPGVPMDMTRIRDRDEAYWDAHRGTPKVFLPLEAGRRLFGNRWGEFTALRVAGGAGVRERVAAQVLAALDPAVAGLVLRDLRAGGEAAAASPVDFVGMLLGMSFFLMVAAVALTAMLFRFHLEQRNRESGLLAAVGVPARRIMAWRIGEGAVVVTIGCGLGALLAAAYCILLLEMLGVLWGHAGRPVVAVKPATVAGGTAGFAILLMAVIAWVTRAQGRRSASIRLEAGNEEVPRDRPAGRPWGMIAAAVAGCAALGASSTIGNQGAFFAAGALFLIYGLLACRRRLRRGLDERVLDVGRLVEINWRRRGTRTLVVVGSLAAGVFLVVSVAAFRKHGGEGDLARPGGSGGYGWWVEVTNPSGRTAAAGTEDALGLGSLRGSLGEVMPLRVGGGEAADCFNVSAVGQPRLLAARVAEFDRRGSFAIRKVLPGYEKSWRTLAEGEVMRAFVDASTLQWVLKRKLGDRLVYQDEWGGDYQVEIAGTLGDTVFQGCLVVDESRYLQHHPGAGAPRVFLVDHGQRPVAREWLQRALADRGPVVTGTGERLAAFHGVENTYIAIFHLLGGLGVVLGSAGLGLVTARNLMERRGEFALLHTLGIADPVTRRVLRAEVARSIAWGLGIGVLAALVAVAPVVTADRPWAVIGWIVLLAALTGGVAWGASWLVLRRRFGSVLELPREGG